jgi:tetratricopeptide (TPR) repeat protein
MATTVKPTATPSQAAKPATPWYREQRRLLVGGGVGLVLVGAIVYFVTESAARKEQFAARTLEQAQVAADAGNLPVASRDLQNLITTYKGTDAAAQAVLLLNQIRLRNEQAELAASDLRAFLASNREPRYAVAATALLGAALESAKHWKEAGDAYTQASEKANQDYLKAEYLTSAGRAYRTGGLTDKAIRAYRTVLERYRKTPSLVEAQLRLAELTNGKQGDVPEDTTAGLPAKD